MARCDLSESAGSVAGRYEKRHRHCWGGGGLADLSRGRAAGRAASPRRQTVPTTPPDSPAPSAKPASDSSSSHKLRSTAPSGAFLVVAVLVGASYGLLDRLQGGDWPSAGMVAGITCVASLVGLHVLHVVTRIVVQAMKVVVLAAIVLAIGNWLDWGWAKDATDTLQGLWLASVEQVQAFWARSA